MRIKDITNKVKVCDLILNNNESDRRLWDVLWNKECSNKLLTQNNGRCYFITVNDEIVKIGYSDCQGGIRSTIEAYKSSGNSGRPSDRTHGIHVLIAEELLKGNEVSFYFTYNQKIDFELVLMNGNKKIISQSLSGKTLEVENMAIFIEQEGRYPIWNLQEAGLPWPSYIQESRNALLTGNPAKISDIEERIKKGIK